jgi:hypothetical protein
MGSLKRRLESLEAARMRGEAQPASEALSNLSDAELGALEESLEAEARARGEEPPPNELLEKFKQWEAEEERARIHTKESRRRDRELLERNHALIEAHRSRTKKGATQ